MVCTTSITTTTTTGDYTPQNRAQAQAELLRRHRRMIAEAYARAEGKEGLPPQEEPKKAAVTTTKKAKNVTTKKATKPKKSCPFRHGLAASVSLGQILEEEQSSHSTLSLDCASSAEFTVATVDSELDEEVWQQVNEAFAQQQARVNAVRQEMLTQQEQAQVLYVSRDKVGAASAMRTARYLQAALAQEEHFCSKLSQMTQTLQDSDNYIEDPIETLQQIVTSAQQARAHFQSTRAVKVGDDLLLKEIRKSIQNI